MKILISLLLLQVTLNILAQEQTKYPNDAKLDSCIEINQSTDGECMCIEAAAKEWDSELNKNYNTLMKILNKDNQEILRKAQIAWIIYRDKENELIDKIYCKELSGTMFYPMAYYRKMIVIKTRALELAKYIDILKLKEDM